MSPRCLNQDPFYRNYFDGVYADIKSMVELAVAETNAGYTNRLEV